jgi:hypothetical protein
MTRLDVQLGQTKKNTFVSLLTPGHIVKPVLRGQLGLLIFLKVNILEIGW